MLLLHEGPMWGHMTERMRREDKKPNIQRDLNHRPLGYKALYHWATTTSKSYSSDRHQIFDSTLKARILKPGSLKDFSSAPLIAKLTQPISTKISRNWRVNVYSIAMFLLFKPPVRNLYLFHFLFFHFISLQRIFPWKPNKSRIVNLLSRDLLLERSPGMSSEPKLSIIVPLS